MFPVKIIRLPYKLKKPQITINIFPGHYQIRCIKNELVSYDPQAFSITEKTSLTFYKPRDVKEVQFELRQFVWEWDSIERLWFKKESELKEKEMLSSKEKKMLMAKGYYVLFLEPPSKKMKVKLTISSKEEDKRILVTLKQGKPSYVLLEKDGIIQVPDKAPKLLIAYVPKFEELVFHGLDQSLNEAENMKHVIQLRKEAQKLANTRLKFVVLFKKAQKIFEMAQEEESIRLETTECFEQIIEWQLVRNQSWVNEKKRAEPLFEKNDNQPKDQKYAQATYLSGLLTQISKIQSIAAVTKSFVKYQQSVYKRYLPLIQVYVDTVRELEYLQPLTIPDSIEKLISSTGTLSVQAETELKQFREKYFDAMLRLKKTLKSYKLEIENELYLLAKDSDLCRMMAVFSSLLVYVERFLNELQLGLMATSKIKHSGKEGREVQTEILQSQSNFYGHHSNYITLKLFRFPPETNKVLNNSTDDRKTKLLNVPPVVSFSETHQQYLYFQNKLESSTQALFRTLSMLQTPQPQFTELETEIDYVVDQYSLAGISSETNSTDRFWEWIKLETGRDMSVDELRNVYKDVRRRKEGHRKEAASLYCEFQTPFIGTIFRCQIFPLLTFMINHGRKVENTFLSSWQVCSNPNIVKTLQLLSNVSSDHPPNVVLFSLFLNRRCLYSSLKSYISNPEVRKRYQSTSMICEENMLDKLASLKKVDHLPFLVIL